MYVFREDTSEYLTLDNGFPYWNIECGEKFQLDLALEIINNPKKWGIDIKTKNRNILVLKNIYGNFILV